MIPAYSETLKTYRTALNAAFDVLHSVGAGLPESYYQHALQYELRLRGCTAEREVRVVYTYKDEELQSNLRADIVANDCLVIELKSVESALNETYVTQTLTYMSNLNCQLGLIFNFGVTKEPRYRKVILNPEDMDAYASDTVPSPQTSAPVPIPVQPHPNYLQGRGMFYDILAAAEEVVGTLKIGRLKELYFQALVRELTLRGHQTEFYSRRTVSYKDCTFDIVLGPVLIVDKCFAVAPRFTTGPLDASQTLQCLTYMKLLDCPIGLAFNFGETKGKRFKALLLKGANTDIEEPADSPFFKSSRIRRTHYSRM